MATPIFWQTIHCSRIVFEKRVWVVPSVSDPSTAANVWVESPKGKIKEGDTVELHCRGNGNIDSTISITHKGVRQSAFFFAPVDTERCVLGAVLIGKCHFFVNQANMGKRNCGADQRDAWERRTVSVHRHGLDRLPRRLWKHHPGNPLWVATCRHCLESLHPTPTRLSALVLVLHEAVVKPGGGAVVNKGEKLEASCNALSSLQTQTVWLKVGTPHMMQSFFMFLTWCAHDLANQIDLKAGCELGYSFVAECQVTCSWAHVPLQLLFTSSTTFKL